ERWQGREWLSGFTGSAGTLVVTHDVAALWTDSRYWEQAEAELADTGIELMRAGNPSVPSPTDWVRGHLAEASTVAIDGMVLAVQSWRQWQDACRDAGLRLEIENDLLGEIWLDRPGLPAGTVTAHEPPWACRARSENLTEIRAEMGRRGAHWHLISALDDIAWSLNLRGNDIPYNPVFLSHLLIGHDSVHLFVDETKLTAELLSELAQDGIQVQPYDQVAAALAALPSGERLLHD